MGTYNINIRGEGVKIKTNYNLFIFDTSIRESWNTNHPKNNPKILKQL